MIPSFVRLGDVTFAWGHMLLYGWLVDVTVFPFCGCCKSSAPTPSEKNVFTNNYTHISSCGCHYVCDDFGYLHFTEVNS